MVQENIEFPWYCSHGLQVGFFFWHKLFAIYFTGTKMSCKEDWLEGDYEEANGCRSSMVQENIEHPW
jgi:hypothetical protein